jgi:alkylation response protein AidB-like acyl-CoA dehydrogenase
MDFSFGESGEKYREEIRQFLKSNPPQRFKLQHEDEGLGFGGWSNDFIRLLGEKRWIGMTWPPECGGDGRPASDMFILYEEMSYAMAPVEALFYIEAVCYTVVNWGNQYLKELLLAQARKGNITFWEGFSEPGAGSDLLSLSTRARKEGDDFIISGQKIWSSNAQRSDYGYVAVRTDLEAPKHKGISMFILDMETPGITVRPLLSISGADPYAEVFFDEVRVPSRNIVGKVNEGLPIVISCLEADRFWGRCFRSQYNRRLLEKVVEYCNKTYRNGKSLSKDPIIRNRLAELATEIEACRMIFYQALSVLESGSVLTHEASTAKTFSDEMGQKFVNVVSDIIGPLSQVRKVGSLSVLDGYICAHYMNSPTYTIAGGTSEIQRNTIAQRALGLPRM